MTALDTLREQMEEALSRYTLAARVPAASKRDEDVYLVAEKNALLAAHRALVTAELAGEPDKETTVKALKSVLALPFSPFPPSAYPMDTDDASRSVMNIILAVAPILEAPRRTEIERLTAELRKERECEHGTSFEIDCAECKKTMQPLVDIFAPQRAKLADYDRLLAEGAWLTARLAQVEGARDEWKSLANATGLRREQVEFALVAAEARVASLEAERDTLKRLVTFRLARIQVLEAAQEDALAAWNGTNGDKVCDILRSTSEPA